MRSFLSKARQNPQVPIPNLFLLDFHFLFYLAYHRKLEKLRNVETVHVKQLATHELSVEQQLYYKEITEACVGKYS